MKKILFAALMLLSTVAYAALPSVNVKTVNGKTINTSTLVKNNGKPVVISFFATWCKPCMRELKAINEIYADWQDQYGVKMYIVSVDQGQDIKKVKPLVDGMGWEYEVLLDTNGDFKRAMNVQNIPHLFILDGSGKVIYNHAGYTDGSEKELKKYFKK